MPGANDLRADLSAEGGGSPEAPNEETRVCNDGFPAAAKDIRGGAIDIRGGARLFVGARVERRSVDEGCGMKDFG